MFGQQTALQLTDPPVGVLVALALASVGVYGIVLGGWASGSTYPLMGCGCVDGADDLLRARDGAVVRHGVPLCRTRVHRGDRRPAGTRLVHLAAAGVVPHLLRLDGRRDQPRARSTCPRPRASSSRLQHRVLLDAVRAVLPRRIHQHDQRLGDRCHPVPGRLARPVAVLAVGRGRNTGYWTLVWFFIKVLAAHVHLRLAPRNAPAPPVRPVHDDGLEDSHPDLPDVDRARRIGPRCCATAEGFTTIEVLLCGRRPVGGCAIAVVLWPQRRSHEQEAAGPAGRAGGRARVVPTGRATTASCRNPADATRCLRSTCGCRSRRSAE